MMKKNLGFGILLICGLTLTSGCAQHSMDRLKVDDTVDLSTRWNDTDSQATAKEMVQDSLSRPWIENYMKKSGKNPTVIVGTIVNKSHDHIPTETFTKDLERELTNSGRVSFVAAKGERDELREERTEQQENSSAETAKAFKKEIGADYMLKGVINSFEEQDKTTLNRKTYKYFQVSLEMVDLESNAKVWLGDKKIKKLMTRGRIGVTY